jgi:hypothetical protein
MMPRKTIGKCLFRGVKLQNQNLFTCRERIVTLVTNHMKVKLIFVSAALCALFESGVNADGLVEPTANDATISEYSSQDLSLVAQVHVARFFTDYEKRSFFRIGLLPISVAEDIHIQIKSAECLTNALFALHDWNQPSAGMRRLELRNLEITLSGEKQPRLRAASGRIGHDGAIELSTVSISDLSGRPTSIPKATLQVAGSFAGWLHWNLDGYPENLFVFRPISGKTP